MRLSVCDQFKNLMVNQWSSMVQTANGCSLCLDWTGGHRRDTCKYQSKGQVYWNRTVSTNGQACGKKHNALLHGSTNAFCNAMAIPTEEVMNNTGPRVLLPMQWVSVSHTEHNALAFFDSGSNICLIRRQFAERMGLKGWKVTQSLAMTDREAEEWETKVYAIELVDIAGNKYSLLALEMDNITGILELIEVDKALKAIPAIPSNLRWQGWRWPSRRWQT